MDDAKGVVLPYRTTGEEVTRLLDARARGRELAQIATLDYPAGVFQGTVTAAAALDLIEPETGTLTPRGQQYALTAAPEKPALLRRAMLAFAPYALLLEAAMAKGEAETPLAWVVKWWGTHGYGNSDTNRDEGSSAFARMVEFAELGSYVQGRRGHPSRIRWAGSAADRIGAPAGSPPPPRRVPTSPPDRPASAAAPRPAPAAPRPTASPSMAPSPAADPRPAPAPVPATPVAGANSTLTLHLGSGRTVELSVPPRITAAEKRRLLAMVELMVDTFETG